MRNSNTTRFVKGVRLTGKHYQFLKDTKYKKSIAGRLEEINMGMGNCDKCLDNNWSFQYVDGWIIATCQMCGNAVEFKSKKSTGIKMVDGSVCRKCGGDVKYSEIIFKPKQLKKKYYFTACYRCEKCKTTYYSEEFKVFNNK